MNARARSESVYEINLNYRALFLDVPERLDSTRRGMAGISRKLGTDILFGKSESGRPTDGVDVANTYNYNIYVYIFSEKLLL